ncbi:type II toxin-antitoxin system RelE/ParE family toxin [Ochrobactrum soli]|uniref:Plasmid maintenance system killer n=1 Tax=Ochrobactrum soli TaxID=2448455 RepID=A0A849KXT4_9HYPH|nr:type II toxin-antitoxin system RelE/ParE family toxin [[Ochrobactrum] soli]NNU62954.1 plasmid maintenance system killer [[Ochrobactrum] soli]
MIKSFRNKELAALWNTGKSRIDARMHKRIIVRLSRLHVSQTPEEMNVPGFDFHALHGFNPVRFTVHVNGPWCITFVFENGDAYQVDYEQYH